MSSSVKIEFLSTLKAPSTRKWYQAYSRPLASEVVAERLQELIDEQAHRGYEFDQMINTWGSMVPKGKSDAHDASVHTTKPDGLLIVFKKV